MKNSYPIYLTLANLPLDMQMQDENKICVGFIPILSKEDLIGIPKNLHGFLSTLMWHQSVSLLLKPLRQQPKEGFEFLSFFF